MRSVLRILLLGAAGVFVSAHAQEKPVAVPASNSASLASTRPTADSDAGARQLTIREAEALALKNNPQITVGRLRALQSREAVREARSAYLPQAYVNLTAVDSNPGSRIAAGALTNPTVYPRAAAGASVSQLITDFGRTTNLISSSEFSAKAEDQRAIATQQDIILAVDEAYFNALETKAVLKVAQDTIDTRQTLVDQIQALTDAKLRSDLDLSFTKVDLARAKLLLLESRNNYEASLSTLSAILGFPERQAFAVVEPEAQNAPPDADAAPLIQKALQARPEIVALQNEVSSAERFSRAEHDLWWPTASALGVVGQAPARDDHITPWYGAVGVNISIPVFNGFLFNARAKSADLETEVKRKSLQDLEDNVARDVRNSWLDEQKAYERFSVTQQLREQTSLSLDLAQARYKLGLSSIVEYSQAELNETDAELQDADAHYHYQLSQILLSYQIGERR